MSPQPPSEIPASGPPISGYCRICGADAIMYRDPGENEWYRKKVVDCELKSVPTKCFKCRKGPGDDPANTPAPPPRSDTPPPSPTPSPAPALTPRSDTPSSSPTPFPTPGLPPRSGAPPSSPTPTLRPPQLGEAAALDVLVAELLVQNNHFLCERLVDAERKQDLAEAAIAELRDKLTHAGFALERGRAVELHAAAAATGGGSGGRGGRSVRGGRGLDLACSRDDVLSHQEWVPSKRTGRNNRRTRARAGALARELSEPLAQRVAARDRAARVRRAVDKPVAAAERERLLARADRRVRQLGVRPIGAGRVPKARGLVEPERVHARLEHTTTRALGR